MRRKNAAFLFILTLACVLLVPSCAVLTRTSEQGIPVTSFPAGAAVIVNGIWQGRTPLAIKFTRWEKGHVVRIESPGYNPVEIRLRREVSADTILGSFLLGLVPGIAPALAGLGLSHTRSDPSAEKMILSIYFGSAAVLGGLFALMDLGSGQEYTLTPKNLTVTLTKADGTPRVDTVLIDADDLRNVKWIRVLSGEER